MCLAPVAPQTNRRGSTAFEPGSGSTIMAYAGKCEGQNLQRNSDPLFHAGSIEEIRNILAPHQNLSNCGLSQDQVTPPITTTSPPEVSVAQASYVIPANTPFSLTAQATDPDGDELTYIWEQIDAGGNSGATGSRAEVQQDNGSNPLFRSFVATANPTRYFPTLSSLLNDTEILGEVLPSTNRDLTFRVTAKDNKGGVNAADVSLSVSDTGQAFSLSQPTGSWVGNTTQTINWQTANTQNAPISCANLTLLMDIDGSGEFATTVAH